MCSRNPSSARLQPETGPGGEPNALLTLRDPARAEPTATFAATAGGWYVGRIFDVIGAVLFVYLGLFVFTILFSGLALID